MNVSPIPTTRIQKDHPKNQIIGDINSATQTRRMTKISEEHAMVSCIKKQRRTNHKDYQNCLFVYFLSQIEPKKVTQALTDPSWIEAMQDELLQFSLQKLETGKIDVQGYTQEEGIDYDEVFAHVAKIEAISEDNKHSNTNKALLKDEEAKDVDARFQVTPKVSHLNVVKRIFRYLKGQPKLGLWYPRYSSFDLKAFFDSDYVGASLDKKSTTGGFVDSKSNA
ncbi:hypothetical protein Tco_0099000 [Tanacetum coccineum]